VVDDEVLSIHFAHVDTNRLHSMVNTAMCQCLYEDKLSVSFMERMVRTHAKLDITPGQYAHYVALFLRCLDGAKVPPRLQQRMARMLHELRVCIVERRMPEEPPLLADDGAALAAAAGDHHSAASMAAAAAGGAAAVASVCPFMREQHTD
jgi:hypothetical protein